jgi:hypothetical protein
MRKDLLCRKRPCRICGRWFTPHPRLKDRQKTCGDTLCKREWHRKQCARWNKRNAHYFKSNYLQKKIDAAQPCKSRFKSGLPLPYVQEVIGAQQLIIIEYLAQLLLRRFQDVFRGKALVITRQTGQLLTRGFSRCDRHAEGIFSTKGYPGNEEPHHDPEEGPRPRTD